MQSLSSFFQKPNYHTTCCFPNSPHTSKDPFLCAFYNHSLKFITIFFFQNSRSISVILIVQLFPAEEELNEHLVSKYFWLITLEKGREERIRDGEKLPKIMDLTQHTCDTTGQ